MSAQAEFDFDAKTAEPKSEASAAIIERIKKLLRLGADKRGNLHEAERAMALAFELAEKYRVDVAGLDLDEESARLVHDYWHVGERYDQLRRGIYDILLTFFHVTACFVRPRMLLIGRPHDVVIARYVHDFLLRAGRECLRAYERKEKSIRRRMTPAKRRGYLAGFIYGIHSNLSAARETMPLTDAQSAIVVAEDLGREKKLDEMFPNRFPLKALKGRENQGAAWSGFIDGKATTINKPLNNTPGATLLLA